MPRSGICFTTRKWPSIIFPAAPRCDWGRVNRVRRALGEKRTQRKAAHPSGLVQPRRLSCLPKHHLHRGETVIRDLLSRWPLIRQIQNGGDGTGREAMTEHTRDLLPKTHGDEVARSICPYCGVGCGQLVYHKDGKLISIEGDPESPISRRPR